MGNQITDFEAFMRANALKDGNERWNEMTLTAFPEHPD